MPRPKKERTAFSMRIEISVFEKLEQFCEDSGQSKTTAVERAIMMYVNDYYSKMKQLEMTNQHYL